MPDLSILRRLERAERIEASAALGVASEIVALEQRRSRLAAIAHSVRVAADTYPRRRPEPGVSPEVLAESDNRRAQLLADVRRQIRQTGVDPAAFNEALTLSSAPSLGDFTTATIQAEHAVRACESELAELEAERARRGRRLGELRASIRAGRDWLAAHGLAEAA